MTIPALAIRSVFMRRRQYLPLFLVCAVCSGLSFFVFFLSNGMSEAFRDKARIYYGGDFQITGGSTGLRIDNTGEMLAAIRPLVPPEVLITARIEFPARSSSLFHEGREVRLRVIKGVDFKTEHSLFERFTYAFSAQNSSGDGTAPEPGKFAGTNNVLISERVAAKLGVREGDSVIFFCRTVQGYINSVELRVGGVFLDSSVLGLYTAYCDVTFLRRAMGVEENESHRISFIFPSPPSKSDIEMYQVRFSRVINMYPLVYDKQIFYRDLINLRLFEDNPTYALIALDANQEDVHDLTVAMNTIFRIIVIMLSLIIIVGIGSTYRVLVLKRVSEIGIYMSIGMRNWRISALLFLEAAILLAAGCLCGFALCGVLCAAAGFINLSSIPGVDIFLKQGVLAPIPTFAPAALFCLVVFVTTGIFVLFTIRRTVTGSPVEAIRATG